MANKTADSISREEYFYGHKACAGCGGSLAVRAALKVLGQNAVSVLPAGCMSAVGFNFPQLCFSNNSIISTFAGTASMLTGVEAGLRVKGYKDFTAVGFAGDGGTFRMNTVSRLPTSTPISHVVEQLRTSISFRLNMF